MASFPTINLDPNNSKREVDLIMNDDDITYRDLSKREKALDGLTTSIHEGLGFNQTSRPPSNSKRSFAISVSLKPAGCGEATTDCCPSVCATIRLNTATIKS
jgi:hypothetical protein